jgi:ATP-dependent helicase/nuclease subunit B
VPKLKLIIGPAGSGKTWRVIGEVAASAAQGAAPGPLQPPLLVIVPEQQAATIERAILRRLAATHGQSASARLHVMSLTRLAAWLMDQAGLRPEQPGDLGRQLLVWLLLPDSPQRQAQAAVYAQALAELAQYGVGGDELLKCAGRIERAAAAGLDQSTSATAAFAAKLRDLAGVQDAYQAACAKRGLTFSPPAALIPELLTEEHWPLLGATQVWVDGFAGFTPVEERALIAILSRCAEVTATLLLDPALLQVDEADPLAREYRPVRELHSRWLALATAAGVAVEPYIALDGVRRWGDGMPLAAVAMHGLYGTACDDACAGAERSPDPAAACDPPSLRALVCADERQEVEQAARAVLALVRPPEMGGRGWRYRDLSVIVRSLAPYAGLIPLVFSEYGIPYFIDQRRGLAHHPAVELVRCGVRLALGLAEEADVYTLLKTDLLPGGEEARARIDELELYARECALRPHNWLAEQPWRWQRKLLRREDADAAAGERQARIAQYDAWRKELLTPVVKLAQGRTALIPAQPTLREVLSLIWHCLITDDVAHQLESWALAAEQTDPTRHDMAQAHRGVLGAIAALFDELVRVAGDAALPPAELCSWLESGLAELDLGYSPQALDAVLVTDVERGRQHETRGALLLGLSEDQWPPPAAQTPLLSDAERRRLIAAGVVISGGAVERAGRELYLALVAATRPSELLHISRPAGDADGRKRQPSPYFDLLCRRLGIAPHQADELAATAAAATTSELLRRTALCPDDGTLQQAVAALSLQSGPDATALAWGREQARARGIAPPLPQDLVREALGAGQAGLTLHCSVSRLETFAACPFKHFARYFLRINEPVERDMNPQDLGGFYHRVLQQIVKRLNQAGCDWSRLGAEEFVATGLQVLEQLGPELGEETGRERSDYVLERARRTFLEHKLPQELAAIQQQGCWPLLTELRFGGPAGSFPALRVGLAGGGLELSGYIDRLDAGADGSAIVVDYKLSSRDVDWRRFLAGSDLQLLAYALALDGQSAVIAGQRTQLTAHQTEYSPCEPKWKHDAADFQQSSVPPPYKQEAKQQAMAGLLPRALEETQRIISELGTRIIAGEVGVFPLQTPDGKWRACGQCGYAALCRFDPLAGGRYHELRPEKPIELRDMIASGEYDFTGSASGAAAGPAPRVER